MSRKANLFDVYEGNFDRQVRMREDSREVNQLVKQIEYRATKGDIGRWMPPSVPCAAVVVSLMTPLHEIH